MDNEDNSDGEGYIVDDDELDELDDNGFDEEFDKDEVDEDAPHDPDYGQAYDSDTSQTDVDVDENQNADENVDGHTDEHDGIDGTDDSGSGTAADDEVPVNESADADPPELAEWNGRIDQVKTELQAERDRLAALRAEIAEAERQAASANSRDDAAAEAAAAVTNDDEAELFFEDFPDYRDSFQRIIDKQVQRAIAPVVQGQKDAFQAQLATAHGDYKEVLADGNGIMEWINRLPYEEAVRELEIYQSDSPNIVDSIAFISRYKTFKSGTGQGTTEQERRPRQRRRKPTIDRRSSVSRASGSRLLSEEEAFASEFDRDDHPDD